jgi:hypothetical protein
MDREEKEKNKEKGREIQKIGLQMATSGAALTCSCLLLVLVVGAVLLFVGAL